MNHSMPIYSWGDAYVAVHRRARASRGTTTIHPNATSWEQWPNTTGGDVVAIAAVVDPFVEQVPRSGNHGALRRWEHCLADLEKRALPRMRETYSGNREFWRALASVVVAMSSADVPLPSPERWEPLFDVLGADVRNASLPPAPFGPFPGIKKIDEIYTAEWQHLKDRRGVEKTSPSPESPVQRCRSREPRTPT